MLSLSRRSNKSPNDSPLKTVASVWPLLLSMMAITTVIVLTASNSDLRKRDAYEPLIPMARSLLSLSPLVTYKVRLFVVSAFSRCETFRDPTTNVIDEAKMNADTNRLVSYLNYILKNTNWGFGQIEVELTKTKNFCNDASAWTYGTKAEQLSQFGSWIQGQQSHAALGIGALWSNKSHFEYDAAILLGRGLNGGLANLNKVCADPGSATTVEFSGDDRIIMHELVHVLGLVHVSTPHDFMNAGYTFTKTTINDMNSLESTGRFKCLSRRAIAPEVPVVIPSDINLLGGYDVTGYRDGNVNSSVCPSYLRAGTLQLSYLLSFDASLCVASGGVYVNERTYGFCQFELCKRANGTNVTGIGSMFGRFDDATCPPSNFWPSIGVVGRNATVCSDVSGTTNCYFALCRGGDEKKKYFVSGVNACPVTSVKKFSAELDMREVECDKLGGIFRDYSATETLISLYGKCKVDFCQLHNLSSSTFSPTSSPTMAPTPLSVGGFEITGYTNNQVSTPVCPGTLRAGTVIYWASGTNCRQMGGIMVDGYCQFELCARVPHVSRGYLLDHNDNCTSRTVASPNTVVMEGPDVRSVCSSVSGSTYYNGCYFKSCSDGTYFMSGVGLCPPGSVKKFDGFWLSPQLDCVRMGGVYRAPLPTDVWAYPGFGMCKLDFCQ